MKSYEEYEGRRIIQLEQTIDTLDKCLEEYEDMIGEINEYAAKESRLRNRYPDLKRAWDEYQIILGLVKDY